MGGSLSLAKCVLVEFLGRTLVGGREELPWSATRTVLTSISWWDWWATGLIATPPCLESTQTWLTPPYRDLLTAQSETTNSANDVELQ